MTTLSQQIAPAVREPSLAGTIVSVSLNPRHEFSKQPQPSIRLIAGEGVEGDAHRGVAVQHRYYLRRDPTRPNLCQVHLFAEEMLDELAGQGYPLNPGELGENVLTRGLDLLSLPQGTRLRLGPEAIVQITGLRTPCSQIGDLRTGLQDHLWSERDRGGKRTRRAGVMSIVDTGGEVRSGDSIVAQMPAEPHHALGPV